MYFEISFFFIVYLKKCFDIYICARMYLLKYNLCLKNLLIIFILRREKTISASHYMLYSFKFDGVGRSLNVHLGFSDAAARYHYPESCIT
jgi:hypothetical protein